MSETDHDKMVRWQGHAREHRSTVNSLFLTYAAALLGLQCSIVLSSEVAHVYYSKFFVAAAIVALVSLIAGGIVVVVRLHDARLTARIVRLRIEKKGQVDNGALQDKIDKLEAEIDALSDSTNSLGRWTNRLIPVQFSAFALAAVVFLIWIFLSYRTKFE